MMMRRNWLQMVMVMLICLLVIPVTNAISAESKSKETESKEAGMIASHKDGDKVKNWPEEIKGTCSNISDDRFLWVVVLPKAAPKYHPQSDQPESGPISKGCKGQWEANAHLGRGPGPEDNGKKFEILLVTVNKIGSIEMQNYINEANQKGKYPGLSRLPDGAKVLHKITVTRE